MRHLAERYPCDPCNPWLVSLSVSVPRDGLPAEREAVGETCGKMRAQDAVLGFLDWIAHPEQPHFARLVVQDPVGRARIAVAGLADRAGVHQVVRAALQRDDDFAIGVGRLAVEQPFHDREDY